MTVTRSELREKIMTILYQISLYKSNNIEYDVEKIISENIEIQNEFVKEMVYGIITYKEKLDEIANENLSNWTIDRLDSMGQEILRMGIYEMKYTDTPDLVVINEAIELAKKFSDDSVRKMINAVLDKLINQE
ncbi:MAG: transcription antitermination factor NusB [Bacilli bacterium]|jgi:N utilization substance protein B|nr:transcription antitermination factor NusB [Bacilli bacterium]